MPIGHLPEVVEEEVTEVTDHRLEEVVHPEVEVVMTNQEVEMSTMNPEAEEVVMKVAEEVEAATKVAEVATIEAPAKLTKVPNVPLTSPLGNGVTKTRSAQSSRK